MLRWEIWEPDCQGACVRDSIPGLEIKAKTRIMEVIWGVIRYDTIGKEHCGQSQDLVLAAALLGNSRVGGLLYVEEPRGGRLSHACCYGYPSLMKDGEA